jgi:hypothetical protein
VKPGIVLSSLRTTSPSNSRTKKSTRARPSHSLATKDSTARRCSSSTVSCGRRDEELHPALVVLRREVVPLVLERVDLAGQRGDRRWDAVAEDAHLHLRPRDELLHQHLLVVPEGKLDGRRELVLRVHLRDAHRGAEPRGLDEHGIAERVFDRVPEPDRVVRRHRDAAVAHDLLEQVLVHRERGGRDPGADVGDVGELEQPLHRPVLPEGAVQDREHDVDDTECLERPALRPNGQSLGRIRPGV